ncbi:MAG: GIY-YIG nuclease family protein [Candidatus Paceibacterota bacterium]
MKKNSDKVVWYVYMLRCADDTLYTGITTDLKRRVKEHNEDDKLGAKYTKVRRPVELVYKKTFKSRSEATKCELSLKKLNKVKKIQLFARQK